jgi:ABC-type sugar transport system ATPase subunit
MHELSTAQEQLVQIAAAVGSKPRIVIFDEPTSSLAEPDAQNLFKLIESLREGGYDDDLCITSDAGIVSFVRQDQRSA